MDGKIALWKEGLFFPLLILRYEQTGVREKERKYMAFPLAHLVEMSRQGWGKRKGYIWLFP